MITKQQFLVEHNRLSPPNLQTTLVMLTKFQEEKKPLLKDDNWSIEKLRVPLISWLLALTPEEKKEIYVAKKSEYRNYPETKF